MKPHRPKQIVHEREVRQVGAIIIKLTAEGLTNPDLDLRYVLPDLIVDRACGAIRDNGYDYSNDHSSISLYLDADDPKKAVELVVELIENVPILGNDLRLAASVHIVDAGESVEVYPRRPNDYKNSPR